MFGCCGSVQGSRLFLSIYIAAVFVLLIFTLSAGIYLLYKKDGVRLRVKMKVSVGRGDIRCPELYGAALLPRAKYHPGES